VKKLLGLFVSLVSLNLFSQDFLDTVAKETCECITQKDLGEATAQEKEMQLGVCMFSSISKHKSMFDEYAQGKSLMEYGFEKFGEEVGINMAIYCPLFFMEYAATEGVNFADDEVEMNIELGKITVIEKKQFNVVNLEVGDGSILKFLWLWDFEGSEILTQNQFKGKWMNIYYLNYPLYDPDKKDYVIYKVIEGMELGE